MVKHLRIGKKANRLQPFGLKPVLSMLCSMLMSVLCGGTTYAVFKKLTKECAA